VGARSAPARAAASRGMALRSLVLFAARQSRATLRSAVCSPPVGAGWWPAEVFVRDSTHAPVAQLRELPAASLYLGVMVVPNQACVSATAGAVSDVARARRQEPPHRRLALAGSRSARRRATRLSTRRAARTWSSPSALCNPQSAGPVARRLPNGTSGCAATVAAHPPPLGLVEPVHVLMEALAGLAAEDRGAEGDCERRDEGDDAAGG
jgi:hypothetical protein